MPGLLTPSELETRLQALPSWGIELSPDRLVRRFTFPDFTVAFAFMTSCALQAEKMDHHPDWSNCWNAVDVRLSTHSAGGLTELDFELAYAMNQLADTLLGRPS